MDIAPVKSAFAGVFACQLPALACYAIMSAGETMSDATTSTTQAIAAGRLTAGEGRP